MEAFITSDSKNIFTMNLSPCNFME